MGNHMNKWMIWGVKPPIFGNTHVSFGEGICLFDHRFRSRAQARAEAERQRQLLRKRATEVPEGYRGGYVALIKGGRQQG